MAMKLETPSRHKIQSLCFHETFETEFMNLNNCCFSLDMAGNIMLLLLLSDILIRQLYLDRECQKNALSDKLAL